MIIPIGAEMRLQNDRAKPGVVVHLERIHETDESHARLEPGYRDDIATSHPAQPKIGHPP